LVIAGSARHGSLNQRLAAVAARALEQAGALVTPVDLRALALPIYDADWASRPVAEDGLPSGPAAMSGTVAGLLSASPGAFGGLRSLLHTRQFLQMNLGMLVVPEQFGLGLAEQAFDATGALVDAKAQAAVERVVQSVLRVSAGLRPPAEA
jgi:NAD(P)H-dependent FMN reductase